jgi:hypothetical protein
VSSGERGDSSQDGRHRDGTSAGQKQLASSLWHSVLLKHALKGDTSEFLETTKESSKGGGKDGAETAKRMKSLNLSTSSNRTVAVSSTQDMSQARSTQQMDHREAFITHKTSSYPLLASPHPSNLSLWTSTNLKAQLKSNPKKEYLVLNPPNKVQHLDRKKQLLENKLRSSNPIVFNTTPPTQATLPHIDPSTTTHPSSSTTTHSSNTRTELKAPQTITPSTRPTSAPKPSTQRPNVQAKDRLMRWLPESSRTSISEQENEKLKSLIP